MWDKKITAQYWRSLLDNAHKNIEPMAEFIIGQDLFDSISTEVVKHIKKNELLVTERDKTLISILICREDLCKGIFEDFSSDPLYADIQTFFNAKLSTLSKIKSGKTKIKNSPLERNLRKYLSVSRENNISIQCSQFCANARLLLTFKDLGLKSEAKNKNNSLCWLGIKTSPPQNFRFEDYWFYELQTGVNLSIEISAVLDKLYDDYKNQMNPSQKRNWPILEKIICYCIEDNYRYIAYVPVIDWKISVMKIACTIIGKELAEALLEKPDPELKPLASEIIAARIFAPQNIKTGAEIDSGLNDYIRLLVLQKVSSAFNQVLSIGTMYTLGNATTFAKSSKLSNKRAWVKGQQFAFLEENYNKMELQQQIAERENQTKYGNLADRKDTLVFCGGDNLFVRKYIDELTEFINCNKTIFEETKDNAIDSTENDEYPLQIQKLRKATFLNNKRTQKFEKIQEAIRTAIEAAALL